MFAFHLTVYRPLCLISNVPLPRQRAGDEEQKQTTSSSGVTATSAPQGYEPLPVPQRPQHVGVSTATMGMASSTDVDRVAPIRTPTPPPTPPPTPVTLDSMNVGGLMAATAAQSQHHHPPPQHPPHPPLGPRPIQRQPMHPHYHHPQP